MDPVLSEEERRMIEAMREFEIITREVFLSISSCMQFNCLGSSSLPQILVPIWLFPLH